MEALSRVHLLLSKIGTDIVAIDTASTFGSTRSLGRAFETAVLTERDSMLLGEVLQGDWTYERLASA